MRPELEVFDAGHLTNAKRLVAQGLLAMPQHVDFVLGVPGALDASVRNVVYLVDSLPAGCTLVCCRRRPRSVAAHDSRDRHGRPRPGPSVWKTICTIAKGYSRAMISARGTRGAQIATELGRPRCKAAGSAGNIGTTTLPDVLKR